MQTKDFNSLLQKQIDNFQIKAVIQEQDTTLKSFSDSWKADSLAKNGFRAKSYAFEKNAKAWVIHGMTFKGFSKERAISLLGSPTSSGLGREDNLLILTYVVRQGKSTPDKTLMLYFDKNNRVEDITEESGMQK